MISHGDTCRFLFRLYSLIRWGGNNERAKTITRFDLKLI